MMKKTIAMRKVIALLLGVIVCLPTIARAEKERKSPLTDAPVVRRRLELRDKRFEIGVGAGVTISQDFYNALLIMPKMAFHFNDWLSLAVVAGYNATPDWKSSFNNDVYSALGAAAQANTANSKSPTADDARATMNHIQYFAVGQVEFIPLSGKIAILSSLFSYFDFYVLGGAGVINLAAKSPWPASCQRADNPGEPICKAVTGNELTINAGVGAHAFISRWAALNLELHDLIYKNNASGRSVLVNLDPTDNQPITSDRDMEWTNNFVFSLNIQFFLPAKPKISR